MDNYISHETLYVITYACPKSRLTSVSKSGPCAQQQNIARYYINIYWNCGRISIRCWIQKRHPIPRPNGRAMGVFCKYLWENLQHFNDTALYFEIDESPSCYLPHKLLIYFQSFIPHADCFDSFSTVLLPQTTEPNEYFLLENKSYPSTENRVISWCQLYRYANLHCHRRWQIWHHDNSRFPLPF